MMPSSIEIAVIVLAAIVLLAMGDRERWRPHRRAIFLLTLAFVLIAISGRKDAAGDQIGRWLFFIPAVVLLVLSVRPTYRAFSASIRRISGHF